MKKKLFVLALTTALGTFGTRAMEEDAFSKQKPDGFQKTMPSDPLNPKKLTT